MKKVFIGLALLLFVFSSQAQVSIEWGATLDSEQRMSKIIGEDSDGNVFTLMYKSKDWFIAKHKSTDLSMSFSKEIVLPEINGKDQDFAQIYLMDDKLVIIGTCYHSKEDKFYVTAYDCSLSGIMNKKGNTLLEIDAESRSKSGMVWYKQSPDRSKFLVANVSYDDDNNNYVNIRVFDKNLAVVNKFTERIDANFKTDKVRVTISNFKLNNSGKMFFAMEQMYYNGGFVVYGSDYNNERDYLIIEIDETGKKKTIPIELKDLKVAQMAFIVDKDGNLQVGGLYYKKQTKGLLRGVWVRGAFYVKLDVNTGKKLAENSREFDKEMMLQYRKEKDLEKGKYLDNRYKLKSVYAKPDGGIFMVAEFFDVTQTEGSITTTTTYTYGDLINIDMAADGKINWTRAIGKKQIYPETSLNLGAFFGGFMYFSVGLPMTNDKTIYYSYMADVSAGDILLLYNDNPSNLSPDLPLQKHKVLKNPKQGVPMLASFDAKGELKKSLLKDALDGEEIYLRPQMYYYSWATDTYIIYGSKGLDDKLGRMKFKR